MTASPLRWACPSCKAPLQQVHASLRRCPRCDGDFCSEEGIWRMLSPTQAARYAPFIANYDKVRRREAWGDDGGDYYRALPYRDLSGRHERIWRIRAKSFDALLNAVVEPLSASRNKPLNILDAGAGNGWLSYRLALQGHHLLATELRLDESDGLGACRRYTEEGEIELAQATFEALPICDRQMDLVIFNGSIHYATAYETVLGEALRVLRDGGRLVILDSPIYQQAASGRQMVQAHYSSLRREHQIEPTVVAHENYLTLQRLHELGRQFALSWRVIRPNYGWRWALAPTVARLRGQRQPARFYVIEGQRRL